VPKAKRSRVIAADRRSVWEVVSDPYHRTRWLPKVSRVEDVHERARGSGSQWTDVLTTASGKSVRAQFRCLWSRDLEGYAWEQQIEGSPFAKVLTSSVTSVTLEDRGDGTQVTIQADQRLRGLSRLGGFMLRRATATQIEEALTGLERAVGEQAARG
jgi:carbon monoxide dehydrogenase subunit G